jgi:ornithine cyclodeaminase/alanine dehydrogenase
VTLVIPRSAVAQLLTFEDVLPAVESGHAALAARRADQAERRNLLAPESDLMLIPMLAASAEHDVAGLKLLADTPGNPAHGLPRQQSVILLVDRLTGRFEALLDGALITLFRTAAASAIATKYLARADSHVLGLIGAGAQAWAHVQAISQVRRIDRVVVWSRRADPARALADRCRATGIDAATAESPQQVAADADIVCTLTPSREPVLTGADLRLGQHLNVVGAPPRGGHREVDETVIGRCRLVLDDRQVALAESDAIRAALDAGVIDTERLDAELADVIAGTRPGRTTEEEVTLYNSVGVGIQDIVVARLVVDAAAKHGLGHDVDLTT